MKIIENNKFIKEDIISILIILFISFIGLNGIRYVIKLNSTLNEIKTANNILFNIATKIKNKNFNEINDKNDFAKFFKDNNKVLKNSKILINIIEPDGKNKGLKKIIISITWDKSLNIYNSSSLTIFKAK